MWNPYAIGREFAMVLVVLGERGRDGDGRTKSFAREIEKGKCKLCGASNYVHRCK